jgi:hypothetical protein
VLNKAGVSTDPSYYYEENRDTKSRQGTGKERRPSSSKSKKKHSKRRGSESADQLAEEQQSQNFEFELLVQFNEKKCWALFTCLNRFVHF